MSKEDDVWTHYKNYLVEATGLPGKVLDKTLGEMKAHVSDGCQREELKGLMLVVFDLITIMQGLEQGQNQMDILLHTRLK